MTHNDNDNDNMTSDIVTDAFDTEWDATDIAHLQPEHITRAKPVRGWERKPASPFTKQRLRVGKVWRRAFPAGRAATSNATGEAEERTIKRLRAGQSTQSPLKITKRLCLGATNGVGLQWDKIESPTKRIITRSAAADDLVALSDKEEDVLGSDREEEQVEGVIVEIVGEDGTTMRVDADRAECDEDWSDEEVSEIDAGEQPGEIVDENMVASAKNCGHALETGIESDLMRKSPVPLQKHITLPAGFVSPVRGKKSDHQRSSPRANEVSRRRTLPQTFAPVTSVEQDTLCSQRSDEDLSPRHASHDGTRDLGTRVEQYEDIDEEQATNDIESRVQNQPEIVSVEEEWEDVPEDLDGLQNSTTGISDDVVMADNIANFDHEVEERDRPAGPSPSQQLDLPLRRSPRRKSSSPGKQRSFQTFVDPVTHLVAFSPFKKEILNRNHEAEQHETADDDNDLMQDFATGSPLMLERSVSAPPEEPQMPPRRSERPRVSDDTALLQAFLNRAAENKSSRRLSASKRESLSNRRDSDTVRQALASPAKPEILGALDPNSPSPKKSLAALDGLKVTQPEDAAVANPLQSSGDAENSPARTTRRSHRDKRRVERAAPIAQTRISLRGNTDPVILKRSEAQELATATRANTRKNKIGSIMPTLRLTKLIVEKPPIEESPDAEDEAAGTDLARPGVRRVKWDETLTYYQEAPKEPEIQLFELGDSGTASKLQGPAPNVVEENDSDEALPAPPPAADTPSKPKVRKLRAPRTASNTGKAPVSAVLSEEPVDEKPSTLKLKQSRRSRLATPGKTLDAPSLPPADATTTQVVDPNTASARPKAIPRKKATSRLPAPTPVTLPTSNHEGPSLIASPPKKKSTSGVLPAKSSATKLDFQTKLSAPTRPTEETAAGAPGLMSPAKRGGRNIVFGNAPAAPVFGAKSDTPDNRKVPSLNSPAKKRTRRAM